MTVQEEQVFEIENELNGARRDLRDTMSAVSAKIEHAEGELRPDRLVERYPVGASCLAGALGYIVGSNAKNRIGGPLIFLALLGYAISKGLSHGWSRQDRNMEDDDGETGPED
jgi:hypothetical protein